MRVHSICVRNSSAVTAYQLFKIQNFCLVCLGHRSRNSAKHEHSTHVQSEKPCPDAPCPRSHASNAAVTASEARMTCITHTTQPHTHSHTHTQSHTHTHTHAQTHKHKHTHMHRHGEQPTLCLLTSSSSSSSPPSPRSPTLPSPLGGTGGRLIIAAVDRLPCQMRRLDSNAARGVEAAAACRKARMAWTEGLGGGFRV